jgi:hypothetical protein
VRYYLSTLDSTNAEDGWALDAGVTTAPILPCITPVTNKEITCSITKAATKSSSSSVIVSFKLLHISELAVSIGVVL